VGAAKRQMSLRNVRGLDIDGVEQKQAMNPGHTRSFNRRAAMIAAQQPGYTPSAGGPRVVPD
jgi:hypothetical protein